jgi:hypothetical protein
MKMHWVLALGIVLTACAENNPPELAATERLGPDSVIDLDQSGPGAEQATTEVPVQTLLPMPPPLSATSHAVMNPGYSNRLVDLKFATIYFNVIGAGEPSQASVEFVAPNGLKYELRTQALVGTAFDRQKLEFRLPIVGTVIQLSRLHGPWKADLRVDGKLVATQGFEIAP